MYLQSVNMNYTAVINISTQTTNILKEMWSNKKFDEIWDKVIKMAKENIINIFIIIIITVLHCIFVQYVVLQ